MSRSEAPSFGNVDVHLTAEMSATAGKPDPDTPFRILILGDFSGRANRRREELGSKLAERRPVRLDRDNFDQILARLGVELHLSLPGQNTPRLTTGFSELNDFHPDRLVNRLEVFRVLRHLRQRLNDPSTFEAAAAEVRGWAGFEVLPESAIPAQESSPSQSGTDAPLPTGLLDQMLEEAQSQTQQAGSVLGPEDWRAFLGTLVAPHLVPGTHPHQAALVAHVDVALSKLVRTILHHPDFKAIEAGWRGLFFLTQRLETDAQLQLYLLDLSKAELARDLCAGQDLDSTGLYRLLVEQTIQTPGAQPWAVVAGNYAFDRTKEDVLLLGLIAKIARQAGAPFLSGASPKVVGCTSFGDTPDPDEWQLPVDQQGHDSWDALRTLPEAAYLGLALPRFLLRLPYGQDSEPASTFEFEEMLERPCHEDYVWGNPVFACVHLLARAFSEEGWNMHHGASREIDGLPLHVYQEFGESVTKPCAEVLLTERTAQTILDQGLIPLLSLKDRDAIRLARFQSLADPPQPLAGRWL